MSTKLTDKVNLVITREQLDKLAAEPVCPKKWRDHVTAYERMLGMDMYYTDPSPAPATHVDLGNFAITSLSVQTVDHMCSRAQTVYSLRMVATHNAKTGKPAFDSGIPIECVFNVPHDQNPAEVIRAKCIEALTHELDEWLRVDGKPVRNPHP